MTDQTTARNCGTCEYWSPDWSPLAERRKEWDFQEPHGLCRLISLEVSDGGRTLTRLKKAVAIDTGEGTGGTLVTHKDFGCSEWRENPTKGV